jgi:hypothetical protein
MKKRIIISLILLVAIIALTTAFIPSKNIRNNDVQAKLVHPEAGYIESIGN